MLTLRAPIRRVLVVCCWLPVTGSAVSTGKILWAKLANWCHPPRLRASTSTPPVMVLPDAVRSTSSASAATPTS
ncbi:hypothetical protein BGZ61DRAFT_437755 [Ilyonectria robusta]|uniref:uncharacterized protein n=1 Tax=Ilyonectria robusta TaxID=1079257 RepID=UPI001E8E044D|nr:uncharacterized protein BGZ61DRAFT_437755 [Ilyonectria robusta]KAH8737150.1 hypothetical protein BGZ61DRAFT_437755 [Ilyonectria robusta]